MLSYMRGSGHHHKAIWWVIIIITVVTFLGGFVFLVGSGLSGGTARLTGAVATVDGEAISATEFQNAVINQRAQYVSRFGEEPSDRDQQILESQAFRSLIVQRLLNQEAKDAKLAAHDKDVIVTLQTSPPPEVQSIPQFQTNGQFDAAKYRQELSNPANNWAPFEELVRQQLPVRKLQERLYTSVKLTELDLRHFYQNHYERLTATVLTMFPDVSGPAPQVTEADLQKVYDKYKGRLASGRQVQVELLMAPKQYAEADVKAATDLANGLVRRARGGENFQALAREYSDAPGADKGGVLDRVFAPADFGSELGPKIALMDTGQVTDPIRDGSRLLFFKVIEKTPNPNTGQPGVRVAQITVSVKNDDEKLRAQYDDLVKLRDRAKREGLGKAAASKGLTTTKTAFFDLRTTPNELTGVPDVADWAYGAKDKEVSLVLEGPENFAIAQVSAIKPDGIPTRDQVTTQLQQIAQVEKQLDRMQDRIDGLERALRGGATLEQAAAAVGGTIQQVDGIIRAQQDPRLMGAEEVVGALFAAKPGQVVGPLRGLNAFYAARLDARAEPDWAMFDQIRGQMASQILESKQRGFMDNYMNTLRAKSKVKDLRNHTPVDVARLSQ